jgi:endonuclease YncB( thermonuclease family)/methylphosphotriester-DNA--protein-cysteine methyltransferase
MIMRPNIKAALFLMLMLACGWTGAAQQAASASAPQTTTATGQAQSNNVQLVIEGKIINVHDGDTVTVLDKDNKKFHIRLQGIDAPELKQKYGSESQANLSRMVMGRQVTIIWTKTDKYRRTVGTIMLDGKDMNIEQVKAGLAWHFKKYADEQEPRDRVTYAKAEEDARAAKLGLWQDPNPTPPGDFRVEVKVARWGPPPPEGTVIGNKQSKKYHRPDCPGYRDMAEKNRVFFKSVEEAEAAGYKRAGNCPPESEASSAKAATVASTPAIRPQTEKTEKTTTPAKPAEATITAPAGAIIGNKNSKIYHKPGCAGYNSVSEKNRVFFKSTEEAEAAGYKRAGNCKSDDTTPSAATTSTTSTSPSQPQIAKATTVAASTSAQSTPTSATAATGEIIGNKNSKIYHRPNCPGYTSVSEKNQVKFKSVEEAEAAGYRAAKNCPTP